MSTDRQWKRARLHLVLTAVVAVVLSGTLFFPQNAFAAPAASPAAGASVSELTQYVYEAGNKIRYDKGLKGYVRDARLDKVAMAWAKQQWLNGKMSHNPNYSKQIPKGWTRAGENVASGYSYTQVTAAWAASPSHYANMTRDYTSVGIGYYEADGKRYWAVEFAKYPGTKTLSKPAAPSRTAYAAEPAPPTGSPIALASASFEGSLTGWTAPGATLEGPSTSAIGGKYALKTPGARTVTQTVTLRPAAGGTYTATVWVKPGSTSAVSGALRLTALGGTAEAATMNFGVSSGWMRVSIPLTVQRAGHTGLKVEMILGSGDFRLDAASLVQTGGASAAGARPSAPATPAKETGPAPASRR